jgi:hypothetical protein
MYIVMVRMDRVDEPVRATTNWSIWDAGRLPHAVKRLLMARLSSEVPDIIEQCGLGLSVYKQVSRHETEEITK